MFPSLAGWASSWTNSRVVGSDKITMCYVQTMYQYDNCYNAVCWRDKQRNPNTGLLCGEFTGHRWIPHTMASFDVFFHLRLGKQWRHRWFETPSRSLWRNCNGVWFFYIQIRIPLVIGKRRYLWSANFHRATRCRETHMCVLQRLADGCPGWNTLRSESQRGRCSVGHQVKRKCGLFYYIFVVGCTELNVILTKFSLFVAPKVVKMTTFGATNNENFVKMTFPLQCHPHYCLNFQ